MNNQGSIVSFKNFQESRLTEAFAWALETQRAGGFYSNPLAVHFYNGDDLDDDNGNCLICLFIDEGSGSAILRREWKKEMCLKYNRIVNLEEIRTTAPRSYKKMVQNGLALYEQEGKGFSAIYHKYRKNRI